MSKISADPDTLRRFLDLLVATGDVHELRILRPGYRGSTEIVSGYYDDPDALSRDAAGEGKGHVYLTLNPVNPALLARRANRADTAGSGTTTSDRDITRRRWLLVDCDPARVSGVSATDEEKQLALERAREVYRFLRGVGWPPMIVADSGNGMYLLAAVDLPNDEAATSLVKRVLGTLADQFTDDRVSIDTSVFNAARIIRVLGTVNRKGDNIPERPHRVSKLLDVPESIEVVTREQLEALAGPEPPPPSHQPPRNGQQFDLEGFIAQNLEVKSAGEYSNQNGACYRWKLATCAFCGESDGSAVVLLFGDGRIGYRCHHNRCQGRGWPELREHFEPGYRDRREQHSPPPSNGPAKGMPDLRPDDLRDDDPEPPPPPPVDPWQSWLDSLEETDRTTTYDIVDGDSQLNRLPIGPNRVLVLGGLQGLGKTALVMQCVCNILLLYPDLVALVANCEMSPGELLDRQLARFARVGAGVIQQRSYRGETRGKVLEAAQELAKLRTRLHFMGSPFTMPRVAERAGQLEADLVVVDYLQRFRPSTSTSDQRAQVSDVMTEIRDLASSGPAVIALSAMARGGGFRESSEIEYGADSCYVLTKADDGSLACKCEKNRYGSREDIALEFNGAFQEMSAPPEFAPHPEFAEYAGDFPE